MVQRAEALGYDSVWTAEAYGSDAVTPLAFLAAQDPAHQARHRHHAARRAHARPMRRCAAATVDALAGGGRFIAGIGVSGPQIVEGWYGQPWGKPYWRMQGLRGDHAQDLRARGPVAHEGREISLPYTGPGRNGRRQAAEVDPAHEPRHPDLPRHRQRGDGEAHRRDRRRLAAAGLRAAARCRSTGPGWRKASAAPAAARAFGNFAIQGSVHVEIDSDVKARAGQAEARGGAVRRRHGPPRQELPQGHDGPARLQGEAAERIQELYLAHRKDEAAAAVPDEWVDAKSLVGPPARIKQRYRAWADSGLTGLSLRFRGPSPNPEVIEVMAEAAGLVRCRPAGRLMPRHKHNPQPCHPGACHRDPSIRKRRSMWRDGSRARGPG